MNDDDIREFDDDVPGAAEALDALDARLAKLPRSMALREDGWAQIEARLQPRSTGSSGSWSGFGPRASLAMAASVAALAVVTLLMLDRREDNPAASAPQVADAASVTLPNGASAMVPQKRTADVLPASLGGDAMLGAEFNATRTAVRENFQSRMDELDPRSRELVLANMKVIEDALMRIGAALDANPENALLRDLLISTYQQELAYMGRMTRPQSRDRSRISL